MSEAPDPLEHGRLFFLQPVAFERGVVAMTHLPEADRPEVAFAGRSNVGKSSLLNALVSRKGLARASGEPGRTREINYFTLGERFRLVDLPGYGYAKAPKTEIVRWNALTEEYLRGRPGLKRVFLLVDARHGLKESDIAVMDALDRAAVSHQIVLTKADKLLAGPRAKMVEATKAKIAKRQAAHPEVLAASAHKGEGLDLLRAEIAALA